MTLICDTAGERLDVFLSRQVEDMTRSAAQKLLESGGVTVNGKPVKKNAKTKPGDEISFTLPEVQEVNIQPENIPLDIRYEDDDVIVINKPKDMVVHPAPGHWRGTVVNALMYHCKDSLSGINGELRPGIVHRIDMDTSGLLIAAKNDKAHLALAAQLQDHTLCREYEAIVIGRIKEDSGTIDAPIGRHPVDRKRMTVTRTGGRNAVTHFEVINRYQTYTHLRIRLETGRTHQIRVHMAYRSHPVLGDPVYGRGKELGLATQCLHARQLQFIHPTTGKLTTVTCELPEYFETVLKKLGPPVG